MKQKKSYAEQVLSAIKGYEPKCMYTNEIRDYCLAEIAVMLGVIADILVARIPNEQA